MRDETTEVDATRQTSGEVASVCFGLLSLLNVPVWALDWEPPAIVVLGLGVPLLLAFVVAGGVWTARSLPLLRSWRPNARNVRDGTVAVALVFTVAFALWALLGLL